MNFERVKFLVLSVSIMFPADDANAIMDGFLNGFSSFNNVAQGVNDFVKSDTGQAIFKVVDSAGKLAKDKADKRKNERETAKKREEYFKETDYYVNKEGTLCVFRNGQLMPLGGKKMELSNLLENNVYVLNKKRFIYTTADAIEPTVGRFKAVTFEEGQFYYVNGRLYQFVDNALQLYDVAMDDVEVGQLTPELPNNQSQVVDATTSALPTVVPVSASKTPNTTEIKKQSQSAKAVKQILPAQNKIKREVSNTINNEATTNMKTKRLQQIKTILNDECKYIAKTGTLNLGRISVNSIDETECNLIINNIINLTKLRPTLIKSIIIFVPEANTKTTKFTNIFKLLCSKKNISLRIIGRQKIQNYILRKFNINNATNNIDLTECDISDLTNNEVLFLRSCAIGFLTKHFSNKSVPMKKILLNITATKNSNTRKTNLKIIKDFANVYRKFVVVKLNFNNKIFLL